MNRTNAIKQARVDVGQLYKVGDSWRYTYYDDATKSHRESMPRPYHEAMTHRRQALLTRACDLMGVDEVVADVWGDWHSYLPKN